MSTTVLCFRETKEDDDSLYNNQLKMAQKELEPKKKEKNMWKKHGSAILALVLTAALFLTGVRLPGNVFAAGSDKTSLVKDMPTTSIEFKQGKNGGNNYEDVITDSSLIDLSRNILVNIGFTAVFEGEEDSENRIKKNDFVEFDLGDNIKLAAGTNKTVVPVIDKDSKLKVCDAIFTKNAAGRLIARFDFSDTDDKVFKQKDARIGASMELKADASKINFEKNVLKITLLGKEYEIGKIDSAVRVKKEGVFDPKNSKVDWTIKFERYIKDTNPVKYISLEGFSLVEGPTIHPALGGDYIPGSLRINNKNVGDFEEYLDSHINEKMFRYKLTASDLNPANPGVAVATVSTRVNAAGFYKPGDKFVTYQNTARVVKFPENSNSSSGAAYDTAAVQVKKFGEKTGVLDNTGKKITWRVTLNEPGYDLGDLVVEDELQNDRTGRLAQTFVKATIRTWDTARNKWKGEPATIVPTQSGKKLTFNIPNVKEKRELVIESTIEPDNYLAIFDNDAYAWWNNNTKNKVKLHAYVYTRAVGDKPYGTIRKEADYRNVSLEQAKGISSRTGQFVGNEPEWVINVDRNAVSSPGTYNLYDVFIFDNNTNVSRDVVNEGNGYSVRKVGENSVTSLASGAKLKDIMPDKGKHKRLLNLAKPLTSATEGVTSNVYEIVKDGKVVGHVLETKLVNDKVNFVKFKSRITDREVIMSEATKVDNYAVLTKGAHPVLSDKAEYRYYGKMLLKQTLSAEAANKLLADYNAEAVNDDVINSANELINNQDTTFDRKTKSIVYKISVNAADLKDVDGDVGKFILREVVPDDRFMLVPIAKDKENPANDKYFVMYKGTPAVKEPGETVGDAGSKVEEVNAYGNYLTDAELKAKGISSEYITRGSEKLALQINFDKLDAPYAIFVKLRLKDVNINERFMARNNAYLGLEGYSTFGTNLRQNQKVYMSLAYANYDNRYLWKNYDGQQDTDKVYLDEQGFINWNVHYRPYRVYEDSDNTEVSLVDKLGAGVVLRKEKGSDKLILEGDNYKIVKGTIDDKGNFVAEKEITENLDKIFSYDIKEGQLVVKIPDRNSTYKISYITDFADDTKRGDGLSNSVALYENSVLKGSRISVKHTITANAFARIRNKIYQRLNIVKTDAEGAKLSGAEFSFKKIASGSAAKVNLGTFKTGTDGAIKIEELSAGYYELVETKAPEGYVLNSEPYNIKVVELESGFKVELVGDYEGKATLLQNEIKVINKKKGELPPVVITPSAIVTPSAVITPSAVVTPSTITTPGAVLTPSAVVTPSTITTPGAVLTPSAVVTPGTITTPGAVLTPSAVVTPGVVTPPAPENPIPSVPVIPTTPETPNPVPVIPVTPNPTPLVPSYPINDTPDPNEPNSPDEFEVIGEDGTPQGKVIKKTKPNGEKEYVFEKDGTPLAGFKAKQKKALPRTGGAATVWYYAAGLGLVLMAGFTFKKRKEEEI